ncbi:Metal homeostatis protein BSD2 [Termitomyces sp. T112]|nr:Metal homeostatis protein BSD2 [Termitomyces sp. T112]
MPARYTALNSRADHDHDAQHDMEAAFDYTEDEDDDINDSHESHPLNPTPTSPSTIQVPPPNPHPSRVPGTYDFENVDYDYPPPGSPPRPSAIALPNDYGNSNGLVPQIPNGSLAPRPSWLRRTAVSILPARFAQNIGLTHERPQGAIGGGTHNDGVFANVTAKPTRPVTVQEGDDSLVMPEDTRTEAPPSYASAQADAVPPYWETTVHAPFTPGTVGEIIVDNLPTGSLFAFLWNMLVSVSFQFVGFLFTYLLHTTHAAKLGSRAGLGVTLIQYGFTLRGQLDNPNGTDQEVWGSFGEISRPTTSEGTSPYIRRIMNSTIYASATDLTEEQANSVLMGATTEWLSFFLMTIGWFILLTSLLGFWRVKRWERSILASQHDSTTTTETRSPFSLFSGMENTFSLRGSSRFDFFRTGFGLNRRRGGDSDDEATRAAVQAEEGAAQPRHDNEHALETDAMIPADPNPFNRSRLIQEALEHDRRLNADLRSAGLL